MSKQKFEHGWHGYSFQCVECGGEVKITAVAFNARAEVLFQARCRKHKKCGVRLQSIVHLQDIIVKCLELDGIPVEEIKKVLAEQKAEEMPEDNAAITSRYL